MDATGPLLTTAEVAAMLGVTGAAVTKAARRGRLAAVAVDGHGRRRVWRFEPEAVERYRAGVAVGCRLTCPACGAEFIRTVATRRFCSRSCASLASARLGRGQPPDRSVYRRWCPTCATAFEARDARAVYCSTRCRVTAFYARRGLTLTGHMASIRRARREAGRCACGAEPVAGGRMCAACRERERRHYRARRDRTAALIGGEAGR